MQALIPTALTWSRIAMIPVLVVVYFWAPQPWNGVLAALVFALAGVTDWLDGFLARRWGVMSRFGAFLDPVADKLIVAVALIAVVATHTGGDAVDGIAGLGLALAAMVIIGREIAISALREWMAEVGQRARVKVSSIGKWKTALQMIAIFLLLWAIPLPLAGFDVPLFVVGEWMLYVAAVLTMLSMVQYLWAAVRSDAAE